MDQPQERQVNEEKQQPQIEGTPKKALTGWERGELTEQVALLGMMRDRFAVATAKDLGMSKGSYANPLHGRICEKIFELYEAGESISEKTIAEAFDGNDRTLFIRFLTDSRSADNFPLKPLAAIEEVTRNGVVLRLNEVSRRFSDESLKDPTAALQHFVDEVVSLREIHKGLLSASPLISRETAAEFKQITGAARLDDYEEEWDAGRNIPVSTGFPIIDGLFDGGLYPGLYVLGASSSIGKTTLLLQMADYIAANERDVIFFSLEESVDSLEGKSISRMASGEWKRELLNKGDEKESLVHTVAAGAMTLRQVTAKHERGRWTPMQREAYIAARNRYKETSGAHIYYFEGNFDTGVTKVAEKVKQLIKLSKANPNSGRDPRPVVFVDYFQALTPINERFTDKQNVDRNIIELKRISRDNNIPIVAASSINRDGYYGKIQLSSFKESGAVEFTADTLIGLHPIGLKDGPNNETYNKGKIDECRNSPIRNIEFVVLKNRAGRRGSVRMNLDPKYSSFVDVEEIKPEDEPKKTKAGAAVDRPWTRPSE